VSNSTQPRNLNFHCKERARLGEVFADIAAQYSKSIFPTRSTEGGAFEGDRNPKSQIRIARELALNALQDHEREHQCGALVKAEVEEQLKKRTELFAAGSSDAILFTWRFRVNLGRISMDN
jgi:hypothetical protein